MKTFLEYIKRGTKQVEKGIKKYGKTLDYSELSVIELAENSLEEKIDDVFYTIKLVEKIKEQERELLSLREKLDNRSMSNEVSDKEVVKHCDNCRYNIAGTCHQGHDCNRKSHWQPLKDSREKLDDRSAPPEVKEQTSRSCHDCKHLGTSIRMEPCVICQNKRNWQFREEGSQ